VNQTTPSRVRVIPFQHGLGALDYAVPAGMALGPGDAVEIPLGPRRILGVVWDMDALAAPDAAAPARAPAATPAATTLRAV
jgi:primosomal protein N' (replication factor Y)